MNILFINSMHVRNLTKRVYCLFFWEGRGGRQIFQLRVYGYCHGIDTTDYIHGIGSWEAGYVSHTRYIQIPTVGIEAIYMYNHKSIKIIKYLALLCFELFCQGPTQNFIGHTSIPGHVLAIHAHNLYSSHFNTDRCNAMLLHSREFGTESFLWKFYHTEAL